MKGMKDKGSYCLPKKDVTGMGSKKIPTKPADVKPKSPTFKTGKSG